MAGPGELWPLTAAGCGVVNVEAFARLHVRKRGARSTGNPSVSSSQVVRCSRATWLTSRALALKGPQGLDEESPPAPVEAPERPQPGGHGPLLTTPDTPQQLRRQQPEQTG